MLHGSLLTHESSLVEEMISEVKIALLLNALFLGNSTSKKLSHLRFQPH